MSSPECAVGPSGSGSDREQGVIGPRVGRNRRVVARGTQPMPWATPLLASLEWWSTIAASGGNDSGTAAGSPTRHGAWGASR